MRKTLLAAASFAALFVAAAPASAAITIYTDQAAFLAAITNPGVDSYDDLFFVDYGPSLPRAAGPYQYLASADSGIFGLNNGDGFLSVNNADDTLSLDGFSPAVSAVGGFFFTTDFSGFANGGDLTLQATDADGAAFYDVLGGTGFVGFVSNKSITSLTVTPVAGTGSWVTVNDLTLGVPGVVPEPATWAFMIGGFGLAGAALRRRKLALA